MIHGPRQALVVLVAGPNGAGKSTSAARLLRGALVVEEFVNADTIAQGLSAYQPESAAVAAGRVMIERLRLLARERRDFAFETDPGRTPSRALAPSAPVVRLSRHLVFLSLPSADLAVARVVERVRQGGHHVPDAIVRRRFSAGLTNFFTYYMDIVDGGQMYDNADVEGPRLIASRRGGAVPVVVDGAKWTHLEAQR